MVLASSPRNAVLVQLRRPAASDLLRMLRKPTRFRVTRLNNYARELEALNRGLVAALDGPASSPTVNGSFEDLVGLAEAELYRLYDLVAPEVTGWGKELGTVCRKTAPSMVQDEGRADPATTASQ